MNRYRFLLSLVRKHLLSYLVGIVMIFLTMWMSFAIPDNLEQAIDVLRSDPDPTGRVFLGHIGWILAFAVLVIFTRTASRLLFLIPGRKVEYELKNSLLEHLTTLQREYFKANSTGSIISRINNDINGIRMMMGFALMQLLNAVATLSLAPVYMYNISPRLTLYCAPPVLFAFGVLQVGFRRMRREQLLQMKTMQDLSEFTVETYNGVDVLKSYRHFPWTETRFAALSDAVRNCAIRLSNMRAYLMPILTHIVNGLKVMLVLVGGMMVVESEITMGQFMAYALYLSMILQPMQGMTVMAFMLQRGFTALVSLEAIFNISPNLPPVAAETAARLPAVLQQGLAIHQLNYAYADQPDKHFLNDISLTVAPGEIVGLFGPIGSGKTTLVNTLNGYLTPPPGTILLDGLDVRELGQPLLRRHVVTVSQEAFLFSDTLQENILFGSPDSVEPDLDKAVSDASLDEDLARFPLGLETQVGEKGITLSGGQKQRISLARALLKPCDLLVLDDVLSAVDHDTERFLVDRIYALTHARSILIISHRISALERADRIYVMEEGRISQQGSHAELIAQAGSYAQAYRMQSQPQEAEAPPLASQSESSLLGELSGE